MKHSIESHKFESQRQVDHHRSRSPLKPEYEKYSPHMSLYGSDPLNNNIGRASQRVGDVKNAIDLSNQLRTQHYHADSTNPPVR